MWEIIEAREEKPFESFEDITQRLPTLADPAGMIVKRVQQELDTSTPKRGKNKYNIFTQPPRKSQRKPRK